MSAEAHPVVVGPLLVRPGGEEAVARVRRHDRAAEHHVRDQPVHVDRHPGGIGDRVPQSDGGRIRGRRDVARRGHHVGEPRVRNEHHDRAPHVEQQPQPPVRPLGPGMLPAVPAVVIEVQRERLEEEQRRVRPHRGAEHRREVGPESRVQRGEEEHEHRAPDRGRAVGHEQQARELLRQPVVALVPAEDPDRLRHHGEQRHAQHEGGEHEVHLGRDPHRGPRADQRKLAVGARGVGGGLEQHEAVSHQLSVSMKKGRFFEKSIGMALRTSASSSTVTSRRPWRRA